MGTSIEKVFDAFLARIDELDFAMELDDEVIKADMTAILNMAIFDFRFPRLSLVYENENFEEEITNEEVQVLATLMKMHWLRRQVNTWRLIKQQYTDRDFALSSQANHLAQLLKSLESAEKECKRALDTYSRKGMNYGNLAGGVR